MSFQLWTVKISLAPGNELKVFGVIPAGTFLHIKYQSASIPQSYQQAFFSGTIQAAPSQFKAATKQQTAQGGPFQEILRESFQSKTRPFADRQRKEKNQLPKKLEKIHTLVPAGEKWIQQQMLVIHKASGMLEAVEWAEGTAWPKFNSHRNLQRLEHRNQLKQFWKKLIHWQIPHPRSALTLAHR